MSIDFGIDPITIGILIMVLVIIWGLAITSAVKKKGKKKNESNPQINLGESKSNTTVPPNTTISLANGAKENPGLQTSPAAPTKITADGADVFCAKCGKPFSFDDVFCGDCGARRLT